jgi:hypothetical protein
MADRMPWDITAACADGEKAALAAGPRAGRHLIAVMLLGAALLDLTRCGLVLAAARHPAPTAGLVAAGLAVAVLSVRTARGCQADRRWAGWAALLIGAASAPQAAMSGFHGAYTIPDTATAALGVLLAVAVLATAGAAGRPGQYAENPCTIDRGAPGDPQGAVLKASSARPEPADRQEPYQWLSRKRSGRTELAANRAAAAAGDRGDRRRGDRGRRFSHAGCARPFPRRPAPAAARDLRSPAP